MAQLSDMLEQSDPEGLAKLKALQDRLFNLGSGPANPEMNVDTLEDQLKNSMPNIAPAPISGSGAGISQVATELQAPKSPPPSTLQSLLQHQDSGLADAQRTANASNLYSNMSRVGNNLATALSGTLGAKADNGLADAIAKNADSPIDAIKTSSDLRSKELAQHELMRKLKDEIQQSDPNSPIGKMNSKMVQALAKAANLNLGDIGNISSADSSKMLPLLTKIVDAKQHADSLAAFRQQGVDQKNALQFDKDVVRMGEDIDPNRFRSGEMKANLARRNAADRTSVLLQQVPSGNLNSIQMTELATSVASLLSGGSGRIAQEQINHLTPKTLKGDSNRIIAWLTGNPTGLEQQAWVKSFQDTLKRERDLADFQVKSAQFQKAFGTHGNVLKKDPETFYRTLSAHTDIDPEDIKALASSPNFKGQLSIDLFKKLNHSAPNLVGPSASINDPDVQEYAKTHNISPEKALQYKLSSQ